MEGDDGCCRRTTLSQALGGSAGDDGSTVAIGVVDRERLLNANQRCWRCDDVDPIARSSK
jgi:hypothetical protein